MTSDWQKYFPYLYIFYAPLLVSHIYNFKEVNTYRETIKETYIFITKFVQMSLHNIHVMLNLILLLHTLKQLHLQDKGKRSFSHCHSY